MLDLFSIKKGALMAVDIGTDSIKLVNLKAVKSGYQLLNFGMIPLAPGTIVEGSIVEAEAVNEAIKNLLELEKINVKNVATAVSGASVVIKKIKVPYMSHEELEDSIKFEAEHYIPYDIDEVNLDFHILTKYEEKEEERPEQIEILLVAVKKDKVNEYVNLFSELGLKPLIVDVDVFAIENAYEYNYGIQEGEIVALIDMGAGMTNINILEEGVTTFTRDIYFGGNNYNQAIREEYNISYQLAERLKLGEETEKISTRDIIPLLMASTEEFADEIQKSFDFFKSTGDYRVDKVVLSGGCSKIIDLDKYLTKNLGIVTEIFDAFKNISIDEKSFDPEYIQYIAPFAAVGVGLALRRLGDNK